MENILQANKQSVSVIGKKLKDYFVNDISTSTTYHLKISIMLNPTSLMPPLALLHAISIFLLPPYASLVATSYFPRKHVSPMVKKIRTVKELKKGIVFTGWTNCFYSWTTDFYQTSWGFGSWLNRLVQSCF